MFLRNDIDLSGKTGGGILFLVSENTLPRLFGAAWPEGRPA
jgi:hypothetical protein